MRHVKRAHNSSSVESSSPAIATPNPGPSTSPVATKRKRSRLESDNAMDWAPETSDTRSPKHLQKQSLRETPSGESLADVQRNAASLALGDVPAELCHTFSCRTKFDSKQCKLVHIAYTVSGDIVISDSENQKVKVFDTSGQLKVECSVPRSYSCGLLEPQGVAVLPSSEIIACDRKAGNLKIFTPEGKCLTTLGRQLLRPSGLAVNSLSNIIVSDEGRKDVFIFRSITDRKPVSICKLNDDRISFHLPCQLCVTSTDHIVVYDAVDKKVWLFDKEGQVCSDNMFNTNSFFQQPKSKKGRTELLKQQKYIGGLALCRAQGNSILMGHLVTGRVMRYDISQSKVTREVIEQNNNNMTRPVALASCASGHMAVLEEGEETVKIFRYMS